ncbi:unnamed protein product [Rotaria sp. Silwood1]|nr:unnamed protein product [Rotaria sp. Silwood1]
MNSIEYLKSEKDFSQYKPQPGTSLASSIKNKISFINLNEINKSISSKNQSENYKYKTELCRNYSSNGYCSYSSRCQFAHGIKELRSRIRHPKYKTEICRNFITGYCKYSNRCQFLHNYNQIKDLNKLNYSSILNNQFNYIYLLLDKYKLNNYNYNQYLVDQNNYIDINISYFDYYLYLQTIFYYYYHLRTNNSIYIPIEHFLQ